MSRHTYKVMVERDGRFWLIQVPEVNGATQARKVSEVEVMARDYISIMIGDVPPDSFDLAVEWLLPSGAAEHMARAAKLREVARRANAESAAESRLGARALQAAGLSIKDIGAVMGLSFQRARQLVN